METSGGNESRQFSTFYISNRLYGIDVMKVQEVTKALPMTRVPQAPGFVHGLINLRGQISTAIGLRELFGIADKPNENQMNVVCRLNDFLTSFLVDQIGDVMELSEKDFESPPETIPEGIRKYISGVYKIPGNLLSILDVQKITEEVLNTGKQVGSGSSDSPEKSN